MADPTPEYWDDLYRPVTGTPRGWQGDPEPAVVAAVTGQEPGHAVDLACGTGRHCRWLAGRGWTVTGVDFSPVGLERAAQASEQFADRITWVCEGIATWSPNRPVDLVMLNNVHPGMSVLRSLFVRVAAWLNPGGQLIVTGFDRSGFPLDLVGPDTADRYLDPDELSAAAGELAVVRSERVERVRPDTSEPYAQTVFVAQR